MGMDGEMDKYRDIQNVVEDNKTNFYVTFLTINAVRGMWALVFFFFEKP